MRAQTGAGAAMLRAAAVAALALLIHPTAAGGGGGGGGVGVAASSSSAFFPPGGYGVVAEGTIMSRGVGGRRLRFFFSAMPDARALAKHIAINLPEVHTNQVHKRPSTS